MSLWKEHEVSVLELAMDRPGEIRELCELVEPEVGVVLNIGHTHASKLGSIDAIAAEKLSLPRWLPAGGTAVLNCDDSRVAAGRAGLACRVVGFSQDATSELTYAAVEDLGLDGCRFTVAFEGETARVHSHIPGVHTIPAALAAIGAGLALGLPLHAAARAVTDAEAQGRMQIRHAANGATILDDRYNASPASMAGALRVLAGRPERRFALLGKMAELGSVEESEHRRIGTLAAQCCDVLAAEGDPCVPMVEAAKAAGLAEAHWFSDKDKAAAFIACRITPGDSVLVKASRSQAFETIIPTLEAVE
jgi:UDP-N-acetylmuramoyl-tripeptide--D-alanyl-D-alanine ligase